MTSKQIKLIENYIRKVVRKTLKENSITNDPQIIADLRDVAENGYKSIKDPKTGRKMKVDSYSASAIINIYDQLNDDQKMKYSSLGIQRMQQIAFK